jgi:uncharacterized hydantoinase/oxoprolinase family protein
MQTKLKMLEANRQELLDKVEVLNKEMIDLYYTRLEDSSYLKDKIEELCNSQQLIQLNGDYYFSVYVDFNPNNVIDITNDLEIAVLNS